MDEAVEDTEAVLAAYRERKRKTLEAARAEPPEARPEAHGMTQSAAYASPAVASSPSVVPAPSPAVPSPTPVAVPRTQASATAAPPSNGPVPNSSSNSSSALDVQRPAPLGSPPGATLSPLGPVLRLSDALLKDTKVSVRGSPRARAVGVFLLLAGLLLVVVGRRQASLDAPVDGLDLVAVALVALGLVVAFVGLVWPRSRRLAVRLAASQKEEWSRIQGETRRMQVQARVGLALAIAGLALAAAGYAVLSAGVLYAGAGLALVGAPLLIVAQVRRGLARRLYVQTLVLSGLEASGIRSGAPDDRVQPVIIALDRLLGALPEAEVQAFLATPQARAYLELVDEATRSQRGP